MRLVIDLQGAQSGSRYRGIGRYSLAITKSLARIYPQHDIVIVLSGLFANTVDEIRSEIRGLLPDDNVCVWHGIGPTSQLDVSNTWRRSVSERCREAFILSLQPDVVLITSMFEGLSDDAIVSIGVLGDRVPTAVILYDLIPLVRPDQDFKASPIHIEWYRGRLDSLAQSDLLLAISEQSRQEALRTAVFSSGQVVNISGACDPVFRPEELSSQERSSFLQRLGIGDRFIMYTGGADERKNLNRLLEAFAELPLDVRGSHQLVFVGKLTPRQTHALRLTAAAKGLKSNDLVFTGYVGDQDLCRLYNTCTLFVFPSLHEGFGLPPLEAMSCGAAVVASDIGSLREVVGLKDALFNPESVSEMASLILRGLTDIDFRARLTGHASQQSAKFSWQDSANRAMLALANLLSDSPGKKPDESSQATMGDQLVRKLLTSIANLGVEEGWSGLLDVVDAVSKNHPRFGSVSKLRE